MKTVKRSVRAALLLGAGVTAWSACAAAALPLLAAPAPDPVVAAAAGTTVATSTWLLLLLILELAAAVGRPRHGLTWRRRLPAATGVATMVALALGTSPATAVPDTSLPAPDRAESTTPAVVAPSAPVPVSRPVLVVVPGDSLWQIAEQRVLPAHAPQASVQRMVLTLHAANREVIGPDPDHIRPGTRLRVPTPHGEERS